MDEMATIGSKPAGSAGDPHSGREAAAQGLHVTDRAVAQIRAVLAREGISPAEGGLRLGVMGGGCSGLSYTMRLDPRPREQDQVFAFGEVRVFIDPKSFGYLKGMTLDYEKTLIRQGFNFINPNAARSCGCGTSFST